MLPASAFASMAAAKAPIETPYIISRETQIHIDQIVLGTAKESIIQLTVDKDTCVIAPKTSQLFDGASRADRMERLLALAEKEGPCLFIFRVDYKSNSPEWALLAWAPSNTVLYAERIFFFTALSWLSGSMINAKPAHEFYVTRKEDMPQFHWT